MAGTVPAFHLVCDADAILLNPYGMTDLDGRFLGEARQMDGIGRTHLRTLGAFGAAVTAFVGHFRLHQFCQVRRRTEHLVGTYRYAELAGCAVLCKVAALSEPGGVMGVARSGIFVLDDSQSTVHFLLLRLEGCRSSKHGSCREKCAAGVVYLLRCHGESWETAAEADLRRV